jgi:ABC-2 type transport system ATP-binding protein
MSRHIGLCGHYRAFAPSGTLITMLTTEIVRDTVAGVRVSELTKSFKSPQGPVHAVRGIDITIDVGETVALLGPNGAGKSTTIDILLGLLKPDGGTIEVLGMNPDRATAAGAVGGMLQVGGVISDLSVRELLEMMASLYPEPLAVDEVIALTRIQDLVNRKTTKLSGGQTQRLRFAVGLIANPDLLVLDEPTVAMDVEARRQFWTTMREFAGRGKTVVFATHYLEEADAYADRIILMSGGSIVADGPATEIKARVGMRTIRATLPHADVSALAALPGVASVETRGDGIVLSCADSDAVLRALLPAYPSARDIEVRGAALEDAFVQLTGSAGEEVSR